MVTRMETFSRSISVISKGIRFENEVKKKDTIVNKWRLGEPNLKRAGEKDTVIRMETNETLNKTSRRFLGKFNKIDKTLR